MASSNPNYPPKAPPPHTITMGVGASAYRFSGGQSTQPIKERSILQGQGGRKSWPFPEYAGAEVGGTGPVTGEEAAQP